MDNADCTNHVAIYLTVEITYSWCNSLFSHNNMPERISKIDLLTSSTSVRQQALTSVVVCQ
jgi:hypothetical protein